MVMMKRALMLPINNPADKSDNDNNSSMYDDDNSADAGGDDNSSDNDMEYDDEYDEAINNESKGDDQHRGKDGHVEKGIHAGKLYRDESYFRQNIEHLFSCSNYIVSFL